MNPATADRLRAMTPEEQRVELERLMLAVWGTTTSNRLGDAIDVAEQTVSNWRKGRVRPPLAVLLLLTIWAEGADERATQHDWQNVAESLATATKALGRIATRLA